MLLIGGSFGRLVGSWLYGVKLDVHGRQGRVGVCLPLLTLICHPRPATPRFRHAPSGIQA